MEAPSAEIAYLFRHAVVRDAAYGLQPPSERAVLHGLALRIVESLPGVDLRSVGLELAQHARLAREGGRDTGGLSAAERRYLGLGGDHARAAYDYAAALVAFERLYELTTDGPAARAEVADILTDMYQRVGRVADALARFEEVRAHSAQRENVGRACLHLAWHGVEEGRDVAEVARQGAEIAEEVDSHRLRIAFMMLHAHERAHAGDHTAAAEAMHAAIEYADRTDDWVQSLVGRVNAVGYEMAIGNYAAARKRLEEAEALCDENEEGRHHRLNVVVARAQLAIREGDFETALRYAREAAGFGASIGARGLEGTSMVEVAVALSGLGRFAEAQDVLDEVHAIVGETGDVALTVGWLHACARVMREAGTPQRAVPVLEAALARLQGGAPARALDELRATLEELRA